MAALDNGAACWAVALAPLFAYDAHRVRRGLRSLSAIAGEHPVVTVCLLGYLAVHLLGRFFLPERVCRLDPLSAIARRLEPSRA